MKMLLKTQEEQLRRNANISAITSADLFPVVKFFNPCGAATWLITEMDEDGIMFGLCDHGCGTPELGYVAYKDLTSYRGPFGLGIERDRHWEATKPLSEYAEEARASGRIAA